MGSKYGFETPEDRRKELEEFLRRPQYAFETPRAVQVRPEDLKYQEVYHQLDNMALRIDMGVRDVLIDFEKAKASQPYPQVRKKYSSGGHLHHWQSDSIEGAYLRWNLDEDRAYLLLVMFSPLDSNDKMLGRILARAAGIKVVLEECDRYNWSGISDALGGQHRG